MKKHIELAKKSLTDNTPVTLEELKANKKAAEAAEMAAYWAYRAAESDHSKDVEYYKELTIKAIAEYEELTK